MAESYDLVRSGQGDSESGSTVLALARAAHLAVRSLERSLADLGLTAAEIDALACFGDLDRRAVRELVAATGQRRSTLTGILDRLERRGLAAREIDPSDRRSFLVVLSPAGRDAARRCVDAVAALDAAVADAAGAAALPGLHAVAAAVEDVAAP
jgi:DNA-binding MarR family transcriptional regulator